MNLSYLDRFSTLGFPSDYDATFRTFYAQHDDCHGVLVALLGAVATSLTVLMFGYDDDELNGLIVKLMANRDVTVSVCLDASQAGGLHERAILAADKPYLGNSIVIGTSAFGHQISHEKGLCVDGRFTVGGSTNWSQSGEGDSPSARQNNELTVFDSRPRAQFFEYQAQLIRRFMATQMAAAARKPT